MKKNLLILFAFIVESKKQEIFLQRKRIQRNGGFSQRIEF